MKKTNLARADVHDDGCIDVFVELLTTGSDGVIKGSVHSIMIEPDSDLDERRAALNNSIENDLKFPALTDDDWNKVVAVCAERHTDAVKSAYADYKAQIEAERQVPV